MKQIFYVISKLFSYSGMYIKMINFCRNIMLKLNFQLMVTGMPSP